MVSVPVTVSPASGYPLCWHCGSEVVSFSTSAGVIGWAHRAGEAHCGSPCPMPEPCRCDGPPADVGRLGLCTHAGPVVVGWADGAPVTVGRPGAVDCRELATAWRHDVDGWVPVCAAHASQPLTVPLAASSGECRSCGAEAFPPCWHCGSEVHSFSLPADVELPVGVELPPDGLWWAHLYGEAHCSAACPMSEPCRCVGPPADDDEYDSLGACRHAAPLVLVWGEDGPLVTLPRVDDPPCSAPATTWRHDLDGWLPVCASHAHLEVTFP